MPRRARPAKRAPPISTQNKLPTSKVAPPVDEEWETDSATQEEDASPDEDSGEEHDSKPRISQWVDEDEEISELSQEEPEQLEADLASLSFGALLKARKALAQQELSEEADSDQGSSDSQAGPSNITTEFGKRRIIEKRDHKHAPTEMTSKKAVSRNRKVVETHSVKMRDPRFGEAVGDYSQDHFRRNYSFLSEARLAEIKSLKESLKRARKLLGSSPAHLREDRAIEVEKLERTLKRTESVIQRSKREEIESQSLSKVKKEEQVKRALGKKAWYLKKGDAQKVRVQGRFENMTGQEVKKALEKKQQKISQREKKSRPFQPARDVARILPRGKRVLEVDSDEPHKRRRVNF